MVLEFVTDAILVENELRAQWSHNRTQANIVQHGTLTA